MPDAHSSQPTEPTPLSRRFAALAVALFLFIYMVPLGLRPLFIPDETRYAEIPWEMIADQDWVTLHQVGIRYYEKPPLGYWVNALSQRLFGHNYFAVRFPSALAAGLGALALFFLVRRVRKDVPRAATAAIVFLTFLEVFGVGTFATLDSLFSLFVVLSMVACYLAETRAGSARLAWQILSGIACAAAFLTKGFTALVIPALTLCVWLTWEGRPKRLLSCWAVPLLTGLVAALPAALALHRANPDFWRYFVWVEHVQRFLSPDGDQHHLPFWFFLPVLAAGAVPWTFLLPAAAPEIVAKVSRPGDGLTRFCLAWFVTQFLFFSACGGKLPTYILPGFPPLAILTAEAVLDSRSGKKLSWCALAGAFLFLAGTAGVLIWALHARDERLRDMLLSDPAILFPTLSLVLASACLFTASRQFLSGTTRRSAMWWTALSLLPPFCASFIFLPHSIEDRNSPSRVMEKGAELTPPDAALVVQRSLASAAGWHFRRHDIVLFGSIGEFDYGIAYPEAEGRHLPNAETAAQWLERIAAAGRKVAVCAGENDFETMDKHVAAARRTLKKQVGKFVWALYEPPERPAQ